jgi:Phosphotransferase system IIB components
MDFEETAQQIIRNVGGRKNIAELTHCYTRLRFSLNDNKLANSEAIEKIDGVMQVVEKGGQYQVVIGPDVASVYKVIVDNKMIDQQGSSEDEEPKKMMKRNMGLNIILIRYLMY